jgi:nitrite reductase (NADH) small subunit/3-phenylpropionate/trans-cinnamate dioxygenase ferredoxin subunit
MALIKLCNLENVPPGTIKQFTANEQEILIINTNDQIYCLEARCTHAGAPLAEGTINQNVLTCPWHGSQFNITNGQAVKGPAEKNLKTYTCSIKENAIFIDL